MDYKTWNSIDITENEHLNSIVDSMRSVGWDGLPLLAIDNQLLTGSHRYIACQIAGIAPAIHRCTFNNPDNDDYINNLITDLITVCNDSNDLLYIMELLQKVNGIDDYSVMIMRAECEKE